MEYLSRSLQPYKDVVGQLASFLTIAQFFSGTIVCRNIHNKKSTEGVAITPFVGGAVIGILMLKLSFMMNDPAMLQVNIAAIVLNSIYTAIYYFYSKDKTNEVLKPISIGVGVVAAFLGYAAVENPVNVEFRYGLMVTLLMLLLLASPLMDVKTIIEKEDASSIPFPLTSMGFIVSSLWLLYGIIIKNMFMVVQNVLAMMLCGIQLYLVFKYPGAPGQDKKQIKLSKRD